MNNEKYAKSPVQVVPNCSKKPITHMVTEYNGNEMHDFMPNANTPAALIPLSTLSRLALMLQTCDIQTIKEMMVERLMGDRDIVDIETYLECLDDELNFHVTVKSMMSTELFDRR